MTDERVHVSLSVGVQYPHPVAEVVHHVRQNVFDRVVMLTGLTVSSVDVNVVGLPHEGPPSRRVL